MATVESQNVTPAHNLSQGKTYDTADSLLTIPRGDVTASLNFYAPPEDGSLPFSYMETPPEDQPMRNFGNFVASVTIRDIRGHEDEYSLNYDAFKAIRNGTDSAEKDFTSDESIAKNYYPEVEKLLLENLPGSHRVVIFDHTIRRPSEGGRTPVFLTHIDQTAVSAEACVKRHLGAEAETLLQGRYRIVNVWRPLNGPIVASPLAFASSASVEDEDLITTELRYPDCTGDTAGVVYKGSKNWLCVVYKASQNWLYWSGMQNHERLLFECFDSEVLKEGSSVRGGRVPHSAFSDSRTPAGAPGRESIEVRALVFGP